MKDNNYTANLIPRFLNGKSSVEDEQELKDWIDESVDHKKEFLRLKDVWDCVDNQNDRTEEQLVVFYKRQLEKTNKSRSLWIRYSSAIAAILIIGLIVSIAIPTNSGIESTGFQVFSVPLGSRSKVILADGTEVNLNSGSELRFTDKFSASNRVVSLSGEAYFHVKSDKDHPFVVNTSDYDIKVTGTEFNICCYSDNLNTSATLAEGKIQLQMKGSSQVFDINPNEKFTINHLSKEYSLEKADVESEIAWKDGEFIFRKIPFPDLVQRLERWYDVKLNFTDIELQKFAFTGKFKNQETIWQVLDALKLTSPIDYRKKTFREFTITYKPLKIN